MSSLRGLREAGLLDAYSKQLPVADHDSVLRGAAPAWLPIDAALAHYEACDRLGLASNAIVEMGSRVGRHAQGTFLGVTIRLAKGAGATPWTLLGHARRMWERAWIGSGIGVWKLGPKEARLELVSWPCARVDYCRVAMRGIILSVVELFCERAYVNDVPRMCNASAVAYRIMWV